MRLGLDIGTNSIGWWLYETDGTGGAARIISVVDGGVRIFSNGRDPKSGASLAVDRRTARALRRRRDRYLRRRATLMRMLASAGLMPVDPREAKSLTLLDPYELRAAGLDHQLPLPHFGRALFHLNQRRGFKSNRKTDKGDNESGKIKDATKRLDWAMQEASARTFGEFLHMRRTRAEDARAVPTVRTRLSVAVRGGPDAKEEAGYDFYPDRRHLEDEFQALWRAQAAYHPDILTDALKDRVYETIFYQRPLKEPEVGLCLFSGHHGVPEKERRLPKAHPLTQRRTLYETVNQLRITGDGKQRRALSREERDIVVLALDSKKPTKSPQSMTVKLTALAKTLKLSDGARFTLETGARDAVACDPVRASLSHPDRYGPRWSALDLDAQWEVVRRIRAVQSEGEFTELVDWLLHHHKVTNAQAFEIANAPLPEGYGRLGLAATKAILDHLQAHVVTYAEAVSACGWHHSDQRSGEAFERLPYYGEVLERHVIPGTYDPKDDDITRYGRITNPTVHIGLNQLRRLVNSVIETFGKPDQIVVELARELKQSEDQKRETIKRIRDNTADAKRRSEQLAEIGEQDNGRNRMLLRLWEALGPANGPRCCPYTCETISVSMVFDGSCEVDHILPYSRSLDDGFANRTLCLREANRQKGDQSPWEAWGNTDRWDKIEANLKNLAENKRWRFAPDAMERFEGEREFLDRALVDTQYLARIASSYLDTLFDAGGHVWVVPGRMTEMLRRHWGLNSLLSDADRGAEKAKNRTDHRHHAIDAAVIGATDRGLLNRISKAAGQGEAAGQSAELIARDTDPPWEGFRTDIADRVKTIVVSHRADHGRIDVEARKLGRDSTAGQLHNDTAYGIVDDQSVVSRAPLLSLKPNDILETTKGKNIRDPHLQKALEDATAGKEGKAFEDALRAFSAKDGPYKGIRRVRLVEALQKSARVQVGEQSDGTALKAYKGDSNHCYEIWRNPDGALQSVVVTTFEAHTGIERRHPAAKRLIRLHKDDMVRLGKSKFGPIIATVAKFSGGGMIELVPHNEANASERYRKNKEDLYIRLNASSAIKSGIRRIIVDEVGHFRDPGPPNYP